MEIDQAFAGRGKDRCVAVLLTPGERGYLLQSFSSRLFNPVYPAPQPNTKKKKNARTILNWTHIKLLFFG
jgi:hypothetical protein